MLGVLKQCRPSHRDLRNLLRNENLFKKGPGPLEHVSPVVFRNIRYDLVACRRIQTFVRARAPRTDIVGSILGAWRAILTCLDGARLAKGD